MVNNKFFWVISFIVIMVSIIAVVLVKSKTIDDKDSMILKIVSFGFVIYYLGFKIFYKRKVNKR